MKERKKWNLEEGCTNERERVRETCHAVICVSMKKPSGTSQTP